MPDDCLIAWCAGWTNDDAAIARRAWCARLIRNSRLQRRNLSYPDRYPHEPRAAMNDVEILGVDPLEPSTPDQLDGPGDWAERRVCVPHASIAANCFHHLTHAGLQCLLCLLMISHYLPLFGWFLRGKSMPILSLGHPLHVHVSLLVYVHGAGGKSPMSACTDLTVVL